MVCVNDIFTTRYPASFPDERCPDARDCRELDKARSSARVRGKSGLRWEDMRCLVNHAISEDEIV